VPEKWQNQMSNSLVTQYQKRLAEKLAETLKAPLPTLTPRRVHGVVSLPNKATAVVGMRRAGKTTFLHQLRRERLEQGVARERLVYINFEDEQLAGLQAAQLNSLMEEYYRQFPAFRQKERVSFFLDEIQQVPDWERFIRRVLDTEKVEVFVSGSSAALLSREIATAMRGRAWEVVIHPFSFEEYLRHHQLPVPEKPDFLAPPERSAVERAFQDYLVCGGFPEVQAVDTATHHALLRNYVDVALLRDVMERHGISNVTALRWLVRHLLGNAAGMFSIEKFYASLKSQGLRTSKDSLHDYLSHLEDCFLVRTVWLETASERQRMVNPRKAYPVDPGLIPVFDRTGRANLGHALETVVLIELERRRMEVTYVRTPGGYEVDFLARRPGEPSELIQVCADLGTAEVVERELRALEDVAKTHPKAIRRLLTLTRDAMPDDVPKNVIVQPAYEWLLQGRD
jgi:predicted AAA+ superfamily ATPase